MNIKNSKKIVPATVFAAIIVLLAFSVMSTTVSARVYTTLFPVEGDLGDVVKVTIGDVTVGAGQTVNVADTLPAEFTYIGRFMVNGVKADPNVNEQVVSYNIINNLDVETTYTIEFNVKVTKASWEEVTVTNVVNVGDNPYTENFNIGAFTDLYETEEELTEPVIGTVAAWKIEMGVVKNPFDFAMEDTKITENFAGNLKIDFVTVDKTTYIFEYDGNYGTKEAKVTIRWTDQDGNQNVITPDLDKVGVTTPDGSHIFWTGRTHTAHVVWNIGDLDPVNNGAPKMVATNVAEITIGVSTDTNPAGKQLYGSTGIYYLNSGATLTFIDPVQNMQFSAVAAPIEVEAVSAP